MTVSGAPVRSLHGRSKDGPAYRAPGCEAEKETLAHVLGFCPKGSLLRNTRHNRVRTMIAEAFREKDSYEVHEEVPCIATDDSSRRIDIIVIDRGKKQAWILDPTIRYEGEETQAADVDEEKRKIYEPCVADLGQKYRLTGFDVKVIGLYIGARGTISKFFVEFCRSFSLCKDLIKRVVISVLKGSCGILHSHLYSQQPVTAV